MTEDIDYQSSGPTLGKARIDSLDTLRGFALLGILVMNIQSFSMPSSAYFDPSSYEDLNGLNFVVWLVGYLFFDLKFMAMFSMMFGAGIVLMSRHRDAAGLPVAGLHYRRMFWLLIFGLIHAYVIWYGDILVPYAICGMFVFWVRNWSPRRLLAAGLALFIFGSLMHALFGLGAQFSAETAEAMRSDSVAAPGEQAKEIEAYRGAWVEHFPHRMQGALGFQFFVLPALFFWRISGLMLLGMAFFKWGVFEAALSKRSYVAMVLFGGGLGLPLVAFGADQAMKHDFDLAHVLGYGAIPNWYGSLGVALMWVGLLMLLCKSEALTRVRNMLSAYGRMAFTNYIGQSLLATFIFYGYGFGLFGSVSRIQQVGVVIAIWSLGLTLSPIWLRRFRFGPLEWLWRTAVYMKLQPMRREN